MPTILLRALAARHGSPEADEISLGNADDTDVLSFPEIARARLARKSASRAVRGHGPLVRIDAPHTYGAGWADAVGDGVRQYFAGPVKWDSIVWNLFSRPPCRWGSWYTGIVVNGRLGRSVESRDGGEAATFVELPICSRATMRNHCSSLTAVQGYSLNISQAWDRRITLGCEQLP
jgi:hypothetical protein